MVVPAKKYCDACGAEMDITTKPSKICAVTNCEWEEGRAVKPYVVWREYDVCDECLKIGSNFRVGYRGEGLRIEVKP